MPQIDQFQAQPVGPFQPIRRNALEVPLTPNVIVFVTDDFGIEQIPEYARGTAPYPYQPNLSKLIQNGVRFTRAYGQPWCSPERASFISGRFPFQHGLAQLAEGNDHPLLDTEVTLPAALKLATANTYACAAFGKWHLSSFSTRGGELEHPITCGFDYYFGQIRNVDDYSSWDLVTAERTPGGIATSVKHTNAYAPLLQIDRAIAWMNQTPQPFFCYIPINLPHEPFHTPPQGTYNASSWTLTEPTADTSLTPPSASLAHLRPYLKAMIETTDYMLGRVLDQVEPRILASTTILWMADNGTSATAGDDNYCTAAQGGTAPWSVSHAKRTIYDPGTNVPLIVSGAKVHAPGRTNASLISATDHFHTIVELCEGSLAAIPLPQGGSRKSTPYLSAITSTAQAARTFGLCEFFAPSGPHTLCSTKGSRALVKAPGATNATGYKLVRRDAATAAGVTGFPTVDAAGLVTVTATAGQTDELYDLAADPMENTNRITHGANIGAVGTPLRDAYDALVAEYATFSAAL